MGEDLVPAAKICKIRIETNSAKSVTFGTEPLGWYSEVKPGEPFDLVFTCDKEKESELFYIDKDNWGEEGSTTIVLDTLSDLFVYCKETLIWSNWGNEGEYETANFDSEPETEPVEYKFRFENESKSETIFGIEPLGLFYDIPSKSQLDLTVHQRETESFNLTVKDSSDLIIYLNSVNITFSIDDEICYP